MHKLDVVQNIVGFAVSDSIDSVDGRVDVITQGIIFSDDDRFYDYTDQISNIFLSQLSSPISADFVSSLLVQIHEDLSATVFINELSITLQSRVKSSKKAGEYVYVNDITDIRRVKIDNVKFESTDRFIYIQKIGWRFFLFFDLNPEAHFRKDDFELALADIYRRMLHWHVYKVLQNQSRFDNLVEDGWFPFIEIISKEFKALNAIYSASRNKEKKLAGFIEQFDADRIQRISKKWWDKKAFTAKRKVIKAGLNAYLQDNDSSFILAISTLMPQIEGIIRESQAQVVGSKRGKMSTLLNSLEKRAREYSGDSYSLLLPMPFISYLKKSVFPSFDFDDECRLTRHTSSHGVAKDEEYSKMKALQIILILDQLYFYL